MATTKTKVTSKSDENECATNYNIITNNNWIDTHNMQLTMWCTSCVERAHRAHCFTL